MISDEVYVEIEVLRKQGLSLRQIAAEVGCAVNTVRAHLSTPGLPRYERKTRAPSKLSPYEIYLRERQAAAHPDWIPASVLYHEIIAQGYALLGETMDIPKSRRRWLKRGALLHDVGKLGISNSILDKPGKRDDAEWVAVKRHAAHPDLYPA